ncbi:uncharacterized protein [Amphiura filiformis]|uniref:uncharacterized protein n=1 Tax=Amphiura filiformis TaxID=82378 RepID=UPI003B219092
MRLTHSRNPKHFEYKLGDSVLNETDGHPYLGVFITSKLNWKNHIQQISAKANRTLGFIKRNFYSCPKSTKEAAYRFLVRPLLEYSSAAWDPHTKDSINQIEMIQKRAARFVFNDYTSRTPGTVTNMLKTLEWDSLENRRTSRRLTILQQSRLGHLSLPTGTLLQPVQRQSRHLHCNAYTTITTSKDYLKFSFFPRTIINWNNLPEQITQIEDIPQFKEAVANHIKEQHQD